VCLFVVCGIAGISITDSIPALFPFFLGLVAVLLIVTYVPAVVMLVPNALMRRTGPCQAGADPGATEQ
jgi:TRAP-type C4-dicarboxylate transport system permease large subunit